MKYLLILSCLLVGCSPKIQPTKVVTEKRVVSFTPAITKTIYDLGLNKLLVGVSSFCNIPDSVTNIARVGGLFNPNLEVLMTLKPTDIFIQGQMPSVEKFCFSNNINLHIITFENYQSITNGVQEIGNALGHGRIAHQVIGSNDAEWQKFKRLATNKFKAFICVGRESAPVASCTTTTKDSFISEALVAIGGSNICGDVIGSYPAISVEVIKMRDPDIIFDLQPGRILSPEKMARQIKYWQSIPNVSAVKNKAVFIVTNTFVLTPSLDMLEIAKSLKAQLQNRK